MKKILFVLALTLIASPVFAAGYLLPDPVNQTASGISGADAGGKSEVVRVTDGALHFTEIAGILAAPINGVVDIPAAGVADRTQLPDTTEVYSCTVQAMLANAGAIYVGGVTVTNAAGANEGITLMPGWMITVGKLMSLNEYYVATDNAGDDVKYLCK